MPTAGKVPGQLLRRSEDPQGAIRCGAGDGCLELPGAVDAAASGRRHRCRQLRHNQAFGSSARVRQAHR